MHLESSDIIAQNAFHAAIMALREQYIKDLSGVQAQLKMLKLLEERIPDNFFATWHTIQQGSKTEAEAITRLTLELQSLLAVSKQSKFQKSTLIIS